MWQHYRKTFIPVQLFIFAAVAALYFAARVDPRNLLMVFAVMQLGSIFGARMVGRAKQKLDAEQSLPLARR